MNRTFTAYVEYDPEVRLYAGSVPSLPGAHTQAASLDELQQNLREIIELVLEERHDHAETVSACQFVGIQQVAIDL